MVLYYCTICALYPNLYTLNHPSPTESISTISVSEESDSETINELESKRFLINDFDDLETTSEGLCDHIREIFNLKRQVFNEYQVKAMKRLLIQKSHPQVFFDEVFSFSFFSHY